MNFIQIEAAQNINEPLKITKGVPIDVMIEMLKALEKKGKELGVSDQASVEQMMSVGVVWGLAKGSVVEGDGIVLHLKKVSVCVMNRNEKAKITQPNGAVFFAGVSPIGDPTFGHKPLAFTSVDDTATAESTSSTDYQVKKWLETGRRGSSSETIVSKLCPHLLQRDESDWSHPYDPSDFKRCHLLLEAAPELRKRLTEMGQVSPEWAKLAEKWDDLAALYEEEKSLTSAPKLYAEMKNILNAARPATRIKR